MTRGEAESVPLWRLLRGMGLRAALRLVGGLVRGRRDFVAMGPLAGVPEPPQAPEALRAGPILFQPLISDDWPLHGFGADGGTANRNLIPLPDELKTRVGDWMRRWDAAMYEHLYEWTDDSLRAAFDAEARALCRDIEAALGPEWSVHYGGVDEP